MSKLAIFVTSARVLNILAALVWYVGGIILVLKGISLLTEAYALEPGQFWPWLAATLGLLLGGIKARLLFTKSIKRNLARIAALEKPTLWQFFSPGFFLALAIMIAAGVTLSRLAHGHYMFLLFVGILDLGIGTALLGSSVVYWKQKAFSRQAVFLTPTD